MAEFSVDIRNLVKRHGGTLAVDRLSIQVRRGEFFSILGPSGSGKTSTLRLIAGFEHPDSGDILIEGRSMRGVPPHLRPVNMVFQAYVLFPHLTVFQNIAFGLEMQRLPAAEVRARVGPMMEMVKLTGKEHRVPAQLSGGEQQRVALARALVNRPAVLLLDEPLGALDQQLRQEMQGELKTIQQEVGLTFLFVTHHQEEALTMSDRLAIMDGGRVLQVGMPQELYETPASVFVSQFVGTSNQLPGRLDAIESGIARVTPTGHDRLPVLRTCIPQGVRAGSPVVVIVRPEHLHVSADAHVNGFDNTVSARIEKTVYTGNEIQYVLRIAETLLWKARMPNVPIDRKRFAPGEQIFVRWNAAETRVLTA